MTVQSGGTLTHSSNSTSKVSVADIAVTTLDVQSGGAVNVNGKGFESGNGPGYDPASEGYGAGGAGYGGMGGEGQYYSTVRPGGPCYGSASEPDDLGSGAGWGTSGGSGAGAVKLDVAGTLTLNGVITANGNNGGTASGGGSGGSVWIEADTIVGTGTIASTGGNGTVNRNPGGGGGGRVAVYYTTGTPSNWNISAVGGTGLSATDFRHGGAGTVYIKPSGSNATLTINNADKEYSNYTDFAASGETYEDILVEAGAKFRLESGTMVLETNGEITGEGNEDGEFHIQSGATVDPASTTVNVTDVDVFHEGTMSGVTEMTVTNGSYSFGSAASFGTGLTDLTLTGVTTFTHSSSNPLFSGSTLDVGSGATFVQDTVDVLGVDTVFVRTNGTITHADNSTTKDAQVYISATNMTIETDGQIVVDGYGFDPDTGTGTGTCGLGHCGGGGYGGKGGNGSSGGIGGDPYGSATAPSDLGSGGGLDSTGGAGGGGAIRLVVSNSLIHNGHIGADGGTATGNDSGGGSGGSIWIDVVTMDCTGGGTLSADGGAAHWWGGGGAGGRIAVTYTTYDGCSPSVAGGAGGTYAGAVGSISEEANAPTIDSFTVTPSDPTVNDSLIAEVEASYGSGIDYVRLYVDGSPPGTGLVHTCTYTGSPTSVECDYEVGRLSRGDHTVTAIVTGSDATTRQQGVAVTVSAETTLNRPHFDRLQINEPDVHFTLSFELAGTSTGTLTISFPSGFSGIDVTSAAGTCSDAGTIAGWSAPDTRTAQATKTGCAGTVNVSGITIDLPGDVDSYVIEWSNDDGAGAVAITDDDQITVQSNVDPTMTFD
ncbi:hypothetical protein ACFL26_02510, partial [Patescibacteria group bacterium]